MVVQRPAEECLNFVGREPRKHVDLGAGKECGVHLKRWIFRRCANQHDVAAFDVGQKRVLLGLVEAVDLIDEDDGSASMLAVFSAPAMTSLISLIPESTALNRRKSLFVLCATIEASVVLPEPGGPQRIIEETSSRSIWRRSGFPGPGCEAAQRIPRLFPGACGRQAATAQKSVGLGR